MTDRHLWIMVVIFLGELPRVVEFYISEKVPDHQRGHQMGWLIWMPSEAARISAAQNL